MWLATMALLVVVMAPWACSGPGSQLPSHQPPLAASAPKASLYVSTQGRDDAPGTSAQPMRTLARAAVSARPGTVVIVAAGIYRGSLRTTGSGTRTQRITYQAAPGAAVRIEARPGSDAAWRNTGDYVDIVGFDISGDSVDGLVNEGSFVRILGNHVHDIRNGDCIATANSGYALHDIDVIGNVAGRCGSTSLHHGIYLGHPGGVVANNISYDNAGYGIHCWHNCNRLTIANNLVFGNVEGGIVVGQGDGPNNGAVAADDFLVVNNISVYNRKLGISESGTTGSSNRYVNNLVWGNGRQDMQLQTGSESSTIVADPRFVDFRIDGTGDYHLQQSSPGRDTGVADGAPPTAIDGTPRPRGAGIDLGVYEQ